MRSIEIPKPAREAWRSWGRALERGGLKHADSLQGLQAAEFFRGARPMTRLRYSDEHELIGRYVDLTGFLASPKAQDLVAMSGLVCTTCGAGTPTKFQTKDHATPGREKHLIVCSRCREPRDFRGVVVFKGEIDAGRVIGAAAAWLDDRLEEYRWLRPIFEPRPRDWSLRRWRFARLATFALHDLRIGTVANVVREGRAHAPEYAEHWTEPDVRASVMIFEHKVRSRGVRAGLLRRAATGGRS